MCHMVSEMGCGLCFCHNHIKGALLKMLSGHPRVKMVRLRRF